MSVFIKGMEIPENCMECPFRNIGVDSYICFCPGVDGRKYYEFWYGELYRPDDCPLVEISTPHGRLVEFIDVAVTDDKNTGTEEINLGEALSAYLKMRSVPAIIEAEVEHERTN